MKKNNASSPSYKNRSAIGYIKFTAYGIDCEKFFSDAISCGIKIYEIENIGGIFYAKTAPKNYFFLAKIKKRYNIRMRISEKCGYVFKIYKYRYRYGFILGIVSYALVIYLCSGIVWDVKVTGNKHIPTESILDFMAQNGIYAGVYRKDVKTSITELKALLNFENLAWISIEAEGSRVNVKINESIDNPSRKLPPSVPCNITAYRDGKIISAEIYGGSMQYEIGSGVKKNDVIVSGVMVDGAGNISIGHADAKIIAEFEEEVGFYREFSTKEKIKTDESYKKTYIKLFGFTFPHKITKYENEYTYSSNSFGVTLFGLKMPWSRLEVVGTKMKETEVTRSAEDIKIQLEKDMENHERNFFGSYDIVQRQVEYERSEKGIKAIYKYTLRGDIASQSEIFLRD